MPVVMCTLPCGRPSLVQPLILQMGRWVPRGEVTDWAVPPVRGRVGSRAPPVTTPVFCTASSHASMPQAGLSHLSPDCPPRPCGGLL